MQLSPYILSDHPFLSSQPLPAATKLYVEGLFLPLAMTDVSSKALAYLHELIRLLQPHAVVETIKHIKSLAQASNQPLLPDLSSILTTNEQRTMWLLDAYFLSTLEAFKVVPFDLATRSIDVSQQQLMTDAHLKKFLAPLPQWLTPDISTMHHIVTVSQSYDMSAIEESLQALSSITLHGATIVEYRGVDNIDSYHHH